MVQDENGGEIDKGRSIGKSLETNDLINNKIHMNPSRMRVYFHSAPSLGIFSKFGHATAKFFCCPRYETAFHPVHRSARASCSSVTVSRSVDRSMR
mmetsp:Transcript_28290/g.65542  ORF Transcript_28290/g.65542 Transcript_28290/m.65542 type:complete len:96 (-) Transcript_28290:478-765(-)